MAFCVEGARKGGIAERPGCLRQVLEAVRRCLKMTGTSDETFGFFLSLRPSI